MGWRPAALRIALGPFARSAGRRNIKSFFLDHDFTTNLEFRRWMKCRDRRAAEWPGPAISPTPDGGAPGYFALARSIMKTHPRRGLSPADFYCLDHRQLDLIGKGREMQGQPVKQFPLCRICGEVANQFAFGRIGPELF